MMSSWTQAERKKVISVAVYLLIFMEEMELW
jgi:hypothetical protein